MSALRELIDAINRFTEAREEGRQRVAAAAGRDLLPCPACPNRGVRIDLVASVIVCVLCGWSWREQARCADVVFCREEGCDVPLTPLEQLQRARRCWFHHYRSELRQLRGRTS